MSQEDQEGDEEIRPTPSKKPRYTHFKSFRPVEVSFAIHLNSSIYPLTLVLTAQKLLPPHSAEVLTQLVSQLQTKPLVP